VRGVGAVGLSGFVRVDGAWTARAQALALDALGADTRRSGAIIGIVTGTRRTIRPRDSDPLQWVSGPRSRPRLFQSATWGTVDNRSREVAGNLMRLHVPIQLRWSDLDAYGHVNNAEMLRLLEEARIAAFWATDDPAAGATTAVLDSSPGADTLSLIARQEVEYLAPVPYWRAPLDVQLWVGRMGGASLEVCYEVCSPLGEQPAIVYTRAMTTIVLVDRASDRPRRISAREREAWSPYAGEPPAFRRSR